jgi:hypothetical protein
MSPKPDWETVCSHQTEDGGYEYMTDWTERLKVPGGWLYRSVRSPLPGAEEPDTMAMVFVPDLEAQTRVVIDGMKPIAEWLRDGLDSIASALREGLR